MLDQCRARTYGCVDLLPAFVKTIRQIGHVTLAATESFR
jgi:hypothetical protein